MDSFDNKMTKMQKEINEIKNNIDTMKNKNHRAMNSIVNSINSLSKQNSTRTLSTVNSNRVLLSQDVPYQREGKKIKLTKNNSGYTLRNCLLKNEIKTELNKDYKRDLPTETRYTNLNIYSRNDNNFNPNKLKINTSVPPKMYAITPKSGRIENAFTPQTTTNANMHTYTRRKINSFNTYSKPQSGNSGLLDYRKIVEDLLKMLNNKSEGEYFTKEIRAEDLMSEVKNYLNIQRENLSFINKLSNLYKQNNHINETSYVDLNELYNWIENKQNCSENKTSEMYKNFCEELIKNYNLENFEDLKSFVLEALEKKNKNEKFVIGMKRILCEEFTKKTYLTTQNNKTARHSTNSNQNKINYYSKKKQ